MVRRNILITALLVATLGALGIASAAKGSKKAPEPVALPLVVVLPSSNNPQEARETQTANPDVLPMGTEIELDGHTYTVQDTGGAIAGNRLDLYFDSHEDALRWGVQEKIVRWSA